MEKMKSNSKKPKDVCGKFNAKPHLRIDNLHFSRLSMGAFSWDSQQQGKKEQSMGKRKTQQDREGNWSKRPARLGLYQQYSIKGKYYQYFFKITNKTALPKTPRWNLGLVKLYI